MRRIDGDEDIRALLLQSEQKEVNGHKLWLFAIRVLRRWRCLDEGECEDTFVTKKNNLLSVVGELAG
jgi:hypothetical protein